jgi:hypothetical protein
MACTKQVPYVLHLVLLVAANPLVELHPPNPESYHRAEFNTTISKFIAPFFRPQHKTGHFAVPVIEHQLELRRCKLLVILL